MTDSTAAKTDYERDYTRVIEVTIGLTNDLYPTRLAAEVLAGLNAQGYYVACASCNCSVAGIHYVGCRAADVVREASGGA